MPLQNRVTPFGAVVASPGRGLMMGNRGVLHDDARRIVRGWQTRRWIACLLEFKGIRRAVMTPRRYTELFFLDEAAALSAGHRPCGECRREEYRWFQSLWRARHGGNAGADEMDLRLHGERLAGRDKQTYNADLAMLPDGAYVVLDGAPWLVLGGELYAWSDSGYTQRRSRPANATLAVLTPPSIVAILAAGYRPGVHPSTTAAGS
jgi:hypothetical protein